ncbi:MAG: galactose mutarotase [Spirochaetaceae bacterium]|nr:galactose mutarotase [Spirochaetaceae bacterium]
MKFEKKPFGVLPSGQKVSLWTLESASLSFSLTDYGAAWTSLVMPQKDGRRGNVVLGFSTLDGWLSNRIFMNATVGRFCNRIGGARFTLNGSVYTLDKNDGENCLHSGSRAMYNSLWQGEAFEESGGVFVRFCIESADGDGGFPGNLKAAVTYGLSAENTMSADYRAWVDRDCPLSLTNHAYFNLRGTDGENGGGCENILSHKLQLFSHSYAELNAASIPTGRILPVDGTPLDFRQATAVGTNIAAAGGYDHPYIIDGESGIVRPAAEVYEPSTGRRLTLCATQPAVHFYSGNSIGTVRGRGGVTYRNHDAFCLETEYYPDAPNKKTFPSAIFGPTRPYHEKALFTFTWQ